MAWWMNQVEARSYYVEVLNSILYLLKKRMDLQEVRIHNGCCFWQQLCSSFLSRVAQIASALVQD